MNRSQDEIVLYLRTDNSRDPFGWATADLLEWLDFDHAREFLKSNVTIEEWNTSRETIKSVHEQMIDYMPFAWEKANDCRGLSAGRSMNHYSNWLWLLGEEKLASDVLDYEYYGKPHLVTICKFLSLDASQWDDGKRVNSEDEL